MENVGNLAAALIARLWASHPFKGRLFLIDRLLRLCRFAPTIYGPLVRVKEGDWTNRAAIFGVYGPEIADRIRALSPNDAFLDVGANSGVFSLVASAVLKDGVVIAFEPNREIFFDLCANIAANDASNIIPLNLALSDRDGFLPLETHEGHSGATSLRTDGTGQRVFLIDPANLKALSLALDGKLTGIKIDVEGHELHVLRGLHAAGILRKACWIIVEIDGANLAQHGETVAGVYNFLASLGFRPEKGRKDSEHYDEIFVGDGDTMQERPPA